MFICPTCSTGFEEEPTFVKHFLSCWKQHNPSTISKPAPHSADTESRSINSELQEFFERGNFNGSES